MDNLIFLTEIDDGWPPFPKECIPCEKTNAGYKVMVPPLYVKDISVDDVIAVTFNELGEVGSWRHVEKSGRSNIWLARMEECNISKVLEGLLSLGCNVENFFHQGSCSIDVPADCSIKEVDRLLDQLDKTKVAIAFPSFRHKEQA